MAVSRRGDSKESIRGDGSRKEGNIQKIAIRVEGDRGQEVIVSHEAFPERRASSAWGWYEEFAAEWSETLIAKKRKRNPGR